LLLSFSVPFWFDPSQLPRYVLIARLRFGLSAKGLLFIFSNQFFLLAISLIAATGLHSGLVLEPPDSRLEFLGSHCTPTVGSRVRLQGVQQDA
jgi:hypothetical protein